MWIIIFLNPTKKPPSKFQNLNCLLYVLFILLLYKATLAVSLQKILYALRRPSKTPGENWVWRIGEDFPNVKELFGIIITIGLVFLKFSVLVEVFFRQIFPISTCEMKIYL